MNGTLATLTTPKMLSMFRSLTEPNARRLKYV